VVDNAQESYGASKVVSGWPVERLVAADCRMRMACRPSPLRRQQSTLFVTPPDTNYDNGIQFFNSEEEIQPNNRRHSTSEPPGLSHVTARCATRWVWVADGAGCSLRRRANRRYPLSWFPLTASTADDLKRGPDQGRCEVGSGLTDVAIHGFGITGRTGLPQSCLTQTRVREYTMEYQLVSTVRAAQLSVMLLSGYPQHHRSRLEHIPFIRRERIRL